MADVRASAVVVVKVAGKGLNVCLQVRAKSQRASKQKA